MWGWSSTCLDQCMQQSLDEGSAPEHLDNETVAVPDRMLLAAADMS